MPSPNHGGRRAGAGRPTEAAREEKRTAGAKAVQQFSERALKDLNELYEAQKQLAIGAYYEGCSKCNKQVSECRCKGGPVMVKVYQQLPHQRAGAELINQAKGKAATAQQVQTETHISVSLGCKRCGGYEPLIPRPKDGKEPDGAGDAEGSAGLAAGGGGCADPEGAGA